MRINKINIFNFGKLKNYEIDFTSGLNIIYGQNEDGKSTLMAFIKMMFYGTTGKSSDLTKNLRKKYAPWSGAKMSGTIEFEFNGIDYRLEKEFGASNTSDKTSLWNIANGEKENVSSSTDIGQRFFGIGSAAFEKSVFIGQLGNVINNESDKDDEITQKLSNLVSTGDETTSQKKVIDRLQTAKESLKSKSGKVGILDKKNQTLTQLYDQLIIAKAEEDEKEDLNEKCNQLLEQKEEFESQYKINKHNYDIQAKIQEVDRLDSLLLKKKSIDELENQIAIKNNKLKVGNLIFNQDFIDDCNERISQIKFLDEKRAEKKADATALSEQLSNLKATPPCEVTKDNVLNVKAKITEHQALEKKINNIQILIDKHKELDHKKSSIEELKKQLSIMNSDKEKMISQIQDIQTNINSVTTKVTTNKHYDDEKNAELKIIKEKKDNANTQYQVAIQHTKDVEAFTYHKLEVAQVKLKQITSERQSVTGDGNSLGINMPLLISAGIVLVFSIILGIAINFVFFFGIIGALFLAFFACNKNKIKSSYSKSTYDAMIFSAKENLDNLQSEVALEKEEAYKRQREIEASLKQVTSEFNQFQAEYNKVHEIYLGSVGEINTFERMKSDLNTKLEILTEKISSISSDIEQKQKDLELFSSTQITDPSPLSDLTKQLEEKNKLCEAMKKEIDNILSQKECATIDDFINKNIEWQNYQSKLSSKNDDILKAKTDYDDIRGKVNLSIKGLLDNVSKFRAVTNIGDAMQVITEIHRLLSEIETLNVKAVSQAELLSEELNGKTTSDLINTISQLKEEITVLNKGTYPEKLTPDEIILLKQQYETNLLQSQKAKETLIKLNSDAKNKYLNQKGPSEIESEIAALKKEISEKEQFCECVDIAASTISEAFSEIRQSFGPMLNTATADIFNKLTAGKYKKVMISKNFDINVLDSSTANSREWQYLSSGTIDQAYFSLRLAVSKLLTKDSDALPLLLDDVFMQYDDARSAQGLKFLESYSDNNQIIMFTCHNNIINQVDSDKIKITKLTDCKIKAKPATKK